MRLSRAFLEKPRKSGREADVRYLDETMGQQRGPIRLHFVRDEIVAPRSCLGTSTHPSRHASDAARRPHLTELPQAKQRPPQGSTPTTHFGGRMPSTRRRASNHSHSDRVLFCKHHANSAKTLARCRRLTPGGLRSVGGNGRIFHCVSNRPIPRPTPPTLARQPRTGAQEWVALCGLPASHA